MIHYFFIIYFAPFFPFTNSVELFDQQQQMTERKGDGIKIIAGSYKIIKPLFQVRSYLYAQVCSLKNNYEINSAALYVYENEDPSQTLKMLGEKLGFKQKIECSNLVFPYKHIKDSFNDKNISLFFIQDFIVPLKQYQKKVFSNQQFLELLHGALSSLNHLHMRQIMHGNISLGTCYLSRNRIQENCKFSLNILDTTYFTEEDSFEGIEDKLFQSEGQSMGLKPSYKDDLESLIYVLTHLIGKGKIFTIQRFQLEWITETQFMRWKSCEFFKEMIRIVPAELKILVEIYTIARSLRRNQKPDYLKLMKKVLAILGSNQQRKSSRGEGNDFNYSRPKLQKKESSGRQKIDEKEIIVKIDQAKKHKRKDSVREYANTPVIKDLK